MTKFENSDIRLHMPAIPYSITCDEHSHCAYTGKVKRFAPMMRSRGFEVYHYGTETSESGATKDIQIFSKKEWEDLRVKTVKFIWPNLSHEEAVAKNKDPKMLISDLSNWNSPLTVEFNKRFRQRLLENYRGPVTDLVCVPLGRTYDEALQGLNIAKVESGIGYNGSYYDFRIFESFGWMSFNLGNEKSNPHNYWFVVPNYFDTTQFKLSLTPSPKRIGFLGRIVDAKGLGVIKEIAKRFPAVEFVICGQGDPTPYLTSPNIVYKLPIHGEERSEYIGGCTAMLCLSKFLEPFCGVAVESQLCGTPVVCADWGGMNETVEQYKTGLKGRTLADYCLGVQMALDGKFDRKYIRDRAVRLFDMYKIAYDYEYAFRTILDVHNPGKGGWYSPDSHMEALMEHTMKADKAAVAKLQKRINLFIPYYGAFPNYFQLYLDSLGINKDILTVYLVTDNDISMYDIPDNLVHINMPLQDIRSRISSVIYKLYGVHVSPEELLKNTYKFVDFKIMYPLLFDDIIKKYHIATHDYVGWGDCDLIYGKLSNFIDVTQDYGIIGGYFGHFTAIKNDEEFKNLFSATPNYLNLILDNSKAYIADEIAFRETLLDYLKLRNIRMFEVNKHFCDIIPPCFYSMFRKDHATRYKNFFDSYNYEKNIDFVSFDKDEAKLIVHYDDGEMREAIYCHIQKRKMALEFNAYDSSFRIYEHEFTLD